MKYNIGGTCEIDFELRNIEAESEEEARKIAEARVRDGDNYWANPCVYSVDILDVEPVKPKK